MHLAALFCFVFQIEETEQGDEKKFFISRRGSAITPTTGWDYWNVGVSPHFDKLRGPHGRFALRPHFFDALRVQSSAGHSVRAIFVAAIHQASRVWKAPRNVG
jgi:hypothetical protein